jgi:hypothetical protein
MLPLLQQAWLSRANTSVANSFIQTHLNLGPAPGMLPFPHLPHLPFPPPASSPEARQETLRRLEEAEDLSLAKRVKREEAICPICNITMRWQDLPEHFQTELRCLENIRSLSPIARPASSSSSSRPFSSSPSKSLSLSPSSPGHLENRWQRFERIRSKRRERIGAKLQRRAEHQVPRVDQSIVEQEPEADIDIGDSGSDCGSGAGSDGEQGGSSPGHGQYTEADVLRALNVEEDDGDAMESGAEEGGEEGAIACPSCSSRMRPPVLNVSCWHLKCERCWLKAVGTQKTCSTCNGPASVKDLRRVHV